MIFYFSATGNSLYAAQKVCGSIGGPLISIAESMKAGEYSFTVQEGEKVGIVFPVYFYGLPTIVADFLFRLTFTEKSVPSIFLLLTCGGTTGNAAEQAEKLLARRNIKVDYKFAAVMPDNYVLLYAVLGKSEEQARLKAAEVAIEIIIQSIQSNEIGDHNTVKGLAAMSILGGILYKNGRKTKKFSVTDACVDCGLCERICPVGAIAIKNEKPEWVKERCVHCLACIHRCPKAAIQFGKGTVERGRYINPNVKWE